MRFYIPPEEKPISEKEINKIAQEIEKVFNIEKKRVKYVIKEFLNSSKKRIGYSECRYICWRGAERYHQLPIPVFVIEDLLL